MFIFKCGLIILPVTYISTLCFQVVQVQSYLNAGLVFLYAASGAVVTKIVYDRYQYVRILGALAPDPHVTLFANNFASFSAALSCFGVALYLILVYCQVDDRCLIALSIFVCGVSTLYKWMQCIITTYIASLYYDRRLAVLRQCLANLSFLLLLIMTATSAATSLLPRGASAIYICMVVTMLCSYLLAAIFCIFILSFEKDYRCFAEGLRTEPLLDETYASDLTSVAEGSFRDQNTCTAVKKSREYFTKTS